VQVDVVCVISVIRHFGCDPPYGIKI